LASYNVEMDEIKITYKENFRGDFMGFFKGFGKRSNTIIYSFRHDSNGYYQVCFRMGSKQEDLFAVDQLEDAESAVDELSRKLGESPSSSVWDTRDFLHNHRVYVDICEKYEVEVVDNGNVMTTLNHDTGMITYNTYLGLIFETVKGIPVDEKLAVSENERGFWVIMRELKGVKISCEPWAIKIGMLLKVLT
jgi:hypothetical protein